MAGKAKYGGEFPVRRNVKIGDKLTKRVWWVSDEDLRYNERHENAVGTVVYIHPKRRYYTVRFDFARASFLESFPMRGQFE